MSDQMITTLTWIFVFLTAFQIMVRLYIRPSESAMNAWEFVYGPIYTITAFFVAVGLLIQGNMACAIYIVFAIYGGWNWWHNDRHRRRRKRLRDKAAGRVRDVGGKLKEIRPGEAMSSR